MPQDSYSAYFQNDGTGNWVVQINKAPTILPAGGTVLPFTFLDNNNGQTNTAKAITSSTNATPIVLTIATGHNVIAGDEIYITGHLVNTNANGAYIAGTVGATSIALQGSVGNGIGGATGTFIEMQKSVLFLSVSERVKRAIQNDRSING